MATYKVTIDMESFDLFVSANSPEEAEDKAYEAFMNMSPQEIINKQDSIGWVADGCTEEAPEDDPYDDDLVNRYKSDKHRE